jgi:glycosyltransferase involved in cell wall biosynthesis
MKIAYVTTYDSTDPCQWSGLALAMRRCLEGEDTEVQRIGPLALPRIAAWPGLVKAAGYRLAGRNYHRSREPLASRAVARMVNAALAGSDADVVFSPGTLPIADVQGTTPVAFWTDSTFAQMVGFYPYFSRLATETLEHGHALERRALERAQLAIYSSEWAAQSAIRDYGVPPDRVHVVPFGPHVPGFADHEEAERAIAARGRDRCTLLFVGRDWRRKGGARAVEILRGLRAAGLPAELIVVGPPPRAVPMAEGLTVLPAIDAGAAGSNARLHELYRRAHFLLLPTTADCTPVVISEAAALAVPAVATAVGGLRSCVLHERTGWLLPAAAAADEYIGIIHDAWRDTARYDDVALAAWRHYRERLNWDVAGRAVRGLLRDLACPVG